jgi:MFS family permease
MMETETKTNKKTVRTFAAASFFNDLGSDIVYPVWPLFVTTVLGANMAVLGFLDGLGDALVSISQAVSGYVSDRIKKRKVFVWTGYLFGSASRIGYAFSTVWQSLIPFRILDRAGKIRSAPRDAIIADVSTGENRGNNFGFLRAADNLGAVCGILICIFLVKLIGYRNLFLIAAFPSAIGAVLIIFLVKEKKATPGIYKGITFKDIDKNFRLFLLLSSFFALGSFSYSFLLIFAKTFGFRVSFVPVLYLVFTSVAFLVSIPFGRLSDKTGRKMVLMLSFFFWALVCLSCIFLRTYWAVFLTFVLYGLHKGAIEPVQKAFVSELAPERFKASSLGAFQMVTGLCALPASLVAGLLWDRAGISVPFYLSLFLTAVAMAMLFFVKEKRVRHLN